MRMGFYLLLVLFLSLTLSRSARGQVLYGSLVGNVTDQTGAAVPAASVQVTHTETSEVRTATTNDAGVYSLPTIPAGSYTVAVTKGGFRTFRAEAVEVRVNSVVRVDAGLQVGSASESVQVTAEAALLQTDRAEVRGEFTNRQLVNLPQPTRNYQGVLSLMPGIAPPVASSGGNNNPGKSMQITANGTSRSGSTVRIDGVVATNPWVQFFSSYVPSMEAIEVVNVTTSSADAEQGMVNGAAVNVQTRSGTNDLHGSLFEYHVNSATSARRYFLPANQGIPKFIENDLGGSLGGRIIRNKLFYFGSYEGDFISQAGANFATVPTDALKRGDLSASSVPVYDPATGDTRTGQGRTPFAGNIIPDSRISPITKKLLELIPSPNVAGAGLANNYYVTTPITNRLHRLDTKMDYAPGSKLRVNGRFGFQPYNVQQATVFGDILGGGNNQKQFGNVIATAVSATYVASPTLVIDGNWGLTRANQTLSPPSADKKLGSDFLGIPGTNLGKLPVAGGMPNFIVSNWTTYGYSYPYLNYIQPIYQFTGNATWVKRSHNLRFGVDVSRQHMDQQEVQPTSFTFNGGATSIPGGPASNQYNSWGDFLLGLPQSHQNSALADDVVTLRTWIYSLYVRDQWQVSRKFTINAGLRWEYYPVPTRANRGIESFDLNSFTLSICGAANIPSDCGIQVSKKQFSPRIGIAYRATESFVIRAGYSLSPEQINMYRDGLYSYPARLDYAANGPSSFVPVAPLSAGIPVQPNPNIANGIISIPAGLNFGFQGAVLPKNFVRGYTQSWNFTLQKDFGKGWIAQAGYVGTNTIKQHTRYNVNYGQLGGGTASQAFASRGITSSLVVILPAESMKYHSLQSSLQRRFSAGLSLQANYTWSKWTGICCDDSGDGGPAILIPQYNLLNRALMNADRTHNFRLSGIYELPFGRGKSFLTHGPGAFVAGGWQLNGLLSLYSGTPFTVTSPSGVLNAFGNSQRADQVKPDVAIYGDPQSYFDPLAFAEVREARFGTSGFNTLRGPGVANLDLSVFRNFRLTEKLSARFSAEALNFTNTPHFANPGNNVAAPSRNPDGSIRALNGFTQITATSAPSRTQDERFFRFGLRLSF